uniref:Glycerophosphocholine phosphodiesterase GPCPD1 n=1 Tax=Aceria tosichella TaxID=561515 RepID=A0A6G1SI81_9ACAR
MAAISSHHHMATSCETYSTYLVILKIHGNAIRLFDTSSSINHQSKLAQPTYRILCRDLEARKDNNNHHTDSGVQVFVLDKPATSMDKTSLFQNQQLMGLEIGLTDLAIFMTKPTDSTRKASFAIDIGVSKHSTSMEDLSGEDCKKLGVAYIYLEPKFSTQGVQRMQIMSSHNRSPIGQMQVEYLIVTDPNGYGVKAARPEWLSRVTQLDAGHRGAGSGCRPDLQGRPLTENTVASFNYAARHGADMCELDVMCTADGVPVVYHNYMLNTSQPMQIDELTLDELRRLGDCSIHDANCKHTKSDDNNPAQDAPTGTSTTTTPTMTQALNSFPPMDLRPFPTLEQVLRDVDKTCALNIELKWAQLLPNGKSEATHYREINDFVDRILDCIYKNSNDRPILLSTLSADIAIMLRLKQTKYPVLFLTTGDSQRFNDPATKTVKNAIHLAQAFDMAGINPNAKWLNEYLVRYAKERGLLVYAWGEIKSPQTIKELRRYGLNGVIYDKIDLIKPQD